MTNLPTKNFENKIFKKGLRVVAGIDEVGRGAFAGPVVCGCVVFDKKTIRSFKNGVDVVIDDSKKLSADRREESAKWIKKNALSWGVGVGSVTEINRKKITKTCALGFRRAVKSAQSRINVRIEYLLIDAFYIPYVRGLIMPRKKQRKRPINIRNLKLAKSGGNQLAIINGDAKSVTIAAASIIAKVYRDRLMQTLSKNPRYKKYSWDKNKGYGTGQHLAAISEFGTTRLHRKDFVNSYLMKKKG